MTELKYPLLLCSYKLYEYCKDRYPKREVVADMHVDYDDFYYWTRTGTLRMVRNKNEVWTLGDDWPTIVRIR